MKHCTHIYYNAKTDDFTPDGTSTIGTTHSFHYTSQSDKEISGIHLTVNPDLHDIRKITAFKGKDANATEITANADTTGQPNIFLELPPTAFGTADTDLLTIAITMTDTTTPMFEMDLYAEAIIFPDGFFDNIVPIRNERGAGVITLADGTLVQYRGYGGHRWRWKLNAKFVSEEMLKRLDTLYYERPEFLFAQEPGRYPTRVYRCILENPIFRMPYSSQWKGNGYSIEMEIAQV